MSTDRFDNFRRVLDGRHASNRYRRPVAVEVDADPAYITIEGLRLINACSNDYLNVSRHAAVIEASATAGMTEGVGSTASRLVSGTRSRHDRLESDLADFVGRERSLLFSSGYLANVSVIPALVGRNDHVYIDRLAHNSLYQGTLLSGATIHRFRHNDLANLDKLLTEQNVSVSRRLIVTESMFSMDGDSPDMANLCEVAERHNAILYVDEAHSFGIKGPQGRGMCHGHPRVDLVGTMFGKAMGGMGGAVACNEILAEYLIQHAGGFIYSTALPPSVVGGLQAALKLLPAFDEQRSHLASLQHLLRTGLTDAGFRAMSGESPIIPILIGSEDETMSLARHLKDRGIFAGAIRPPTVPAGQSRIRITLTGAHREEHVHHIVDAFRGWGGQHRP